MTSEKYQL